MQTYLTKTWIYQGKFYGPGTVEVPNDVAEALHARGAFAAPTVETASDQQSDLTPTITPPLPAELLQKLADGGFDSVEAIASATDAELLALKGIGRAALRDIRAVYGGGDADTD
jgi:ERCC4-type nuclease